MSGQKSNLFINPSLPLTGGLKTITIMAKNVNNKSVATKSATAKKTTKSTATKKSASTKRAAAAKKAGIDLSNYFSMAQAEGATVKIVNGKMVLVGKDGNIIPSKTKTTTRTKTVTTTKVEVLPATAEPCDNSRGTAVDRIQQRIIDEGHIENASLHRRWVMAQTFRMLRHADGWLEALRGMGYQYMWHMLMDECKTILNMERNNSAQATARKRCFPLSSIHKIATDCMEKIDRRGGNQLHEALQELSLAETYAEAYESLKNVWRYRGGRWFKKLAMPNEFINCYKAAGAYYTMQNMVMFHGCFVHEGGQPLDQYASLDAIEQKAADCCAVGEGYKLFGMLKQLISDNGFDFQARMAEVYANR